MTGKSKKKTIIVPPAFLKEAQSICEREKSQELINTLNLGKELEKGPVCLLFPGSFRTIIGTALETLVSVVPSGLDEDAFAANFSVTKYKAPDDWQYVIDRKALLAYRTVERARAGRGHLKLL
jgi:hypothetical protein